MVNEHIGRIIAVGSGKGGVGKSTVTSMLALAAAKQGLKAGILDADITGPSIPKLFGLEHLPQPSGEKLEPAVSTAGIRIMSINLLLDDPAKPVVWRGPMVGSVITQFYTDLDWGKLDYLFIDLPPGTSDAPLSVMQSIPVDGFVLVTSPQELSVLVVEKAAAMEKAAASADEAVSRLKTEQEEMAAAMAKEREARSAAESKLGEFEKTREAARESLAAITEKLTDAAENLKRVVAERDALKAELEALKAAAPVPGAGEGATDRAREGLAAAEEDLKQVVAERDALKAELEALKAASTVSGGKVEELTRQLKEREEAQAKLAAEAARLQEALARVREAVAAVPAAPEQER